MYRLILSEGSEKQLLSAIDKDCLVRADGLSLRALIMLMTNESLEVEAFCERLNVTQKELTAALDFFVDAEILSRKGKVYSFETQGKVRKSVPDASSETEKEDIPLMSPAEAALRIAASPELKFLTERLQDTFGRLLTQNEVSYIISICDYTGLSADIMLMITEYASISKKNSVNYIKKVALDWAQRNITTHLLADEQIKQLMNKNEAAPTICRLFEIKGRNLVAKEKEFASKWLHEYNFNEDILFRAYEVCIENIGKLNFSYIDKVLTNWHNDGVKTVSDIIAKPSPAAQSPKKQEGTDEFKKFAVRKRKL